MTELLIIKAGNEYLRFAGGEVERCSLNKASVFPLTEAQEARERCRSLAAAGMAARLMKLTIVEEPFGQEE